MANGKNTLGIEFHEVGFIRTFWVGFSQQRKKPGWRRSSNCVQNSFFRLSPSGQNEKAPLDRIQRVWYHTTILGELLEAAKKAGLTKVVQLRSKLVFSTFPIGEKRKNTLWIEFHEVGFIRPFWVGFSQQGKKPGWRRSSNCVQNSFFRLSPSGQNEKTPLDRIQRVRYHTTILVGLYQGAENAGLTKNVQLRWKLVFSSFPIWAKRKNTLGIEFHQVGFIPPFWVGFTKQRKTPGWRSSSNWVENSFCRVFPSGRNKKTPLGSNSTRSVSYQHFCWALASSAKRRVDEGRPFALKTRFFDFPRRSETKKHPWDRIPRGRFHTTILGWFYQAEENAGLTKVVQLRSKLVFSTFPIGAKRKSTLGIDFHEVGFIPPFWVGFTKQRKTPGWRSPSNWVENSFFRLSPSERNEKTHLGSNSTRSVSYHHFGLDLPSSGKSRVDEGVPVGLKTRFVEFPHQGETKKNPWDRIPWGRFHTTIFSALLHAVQKAGLTKVVQLRWKLVSSSFPIGAKRKNTLGFEFHEVGFIPLFLLGFTKQRKTLGWRRSSNCVQNSFSRVSPSGRNGKTPLTSNSTRSVSYHHFCWALPSSGKRRVDEGRPIAFKTRFVEFPHRCETKKHPWDRIPRGRFHTTILGGIDQGAEDAGLTKVVQLRWKLVFSSFPIRANRKNTLWIEFHEVGFTPPFWVGFSQQRQKPGWRRSSNCVQNSFFRLSPSGRNEKTPLGSNSRRSVSYPYFCWALPSSGKRRVDEKRPIAFKTRFVEFPHRGETKKHPCDRIPRGRFHTTILGGIFQAAQNAGLTKVVQLGWKLVLSSFPIGTEQKNTLGIKFHEVGFIPPFLLGFCKQCKKAGWRMSSNCVENSFFRVFPSGRNEKTPFGSNSTRSASYHHFGWAFPRGAKRRVDEGRPIAFKTRFFDYPHRGKTKKNPWDRIPRGRFHTTILGWIYQVAENAGLTKVVQLRSKLVFLRFPIGAKRKNTLGFEFHEFGFKPQFWVGFCKQR